MSTTPETKVKKRADKLIKELADRANVLFDKDTFGPFLRNGFPDTRYHLGSVAIFAELKADGKNLRKIQELEKLRHENLNYIAIEILGNDGVDDLLDTLDDWFDELKVAERVKAYIEDSAKIKEAIVGMQNER